MVSSKRLSVTANVFSLKQEIEMEACLLLTLVVLFLKRHRQPLPAVHCWHACVHVCVYTQLVFKSTATKPRWPQDGRINSIWYYEQKYVYFLEIVWL